MRKEPLNESSEGEMRSWEWEQRQRGKGSEE